MHLHCEHPLHEDLVLVCVLLVCVCVYSVLSSRLLFLLFWFCLVPYGLPCKPSSLSLSPSPGVQQHLSFLRFRSCVPVPFVHRQVAPYIRMFSSPRAACFVRTGTVFRTYALKNTLRYSCLWRHFCSGTYVPAVQHCVTCICDCALVFCVCLRVMLLCV